MEYEKFLKALRQERKRKGVSLKQIGEKLEMSVSNISSFETGKCALKVKDYFAICDVLQISPRSLIEGDVSAKEQLLVADRLADLSERDFRIIKDLIMLMQLSEDDL